MGRGVPTGAEPCFVRLHWSRISPRTGQPQGVFAAISILEQTGALSDAESLRVAEIREWFETNVPNPPFYREGNPQGAVTWFKASATECLALAREIAEIARTNGVDVHEAVADCPGTVVYEDAFQVAVLT